MNTLPVLAKKHALVLLLAGIAAFLLFDKLRVQPAFRSTAFPMPEMASGEIYPSAGLKSSGLASADVFIPPEQMEPPPSDTTNRLVIRDTQLSMLVSNVGNAITQIQTIAVEFGGYLVSSNLSVPEGASSGTIVIRVSESNRNEALDAIKRLGVRTVSETVHGRDVTDEYIDIRSRLDVLNTTKEKFETLLQRSEAISDLLQVQRELINLQAQIDSLKGQQQYLEQSARLTKITVYLSTDELALPYAPDEVWRPQVVFKQAVRSLVTSLRTIADTAIWLGVYTVVFVPLVIAAVVLYKVKNRRKT